MQDVKWKYLLIGHILFVASVDRVLLGVVILCTQGSVKYVVLDFPRINKRPSTLSNSTALRGLLAVGASNRHTGWGFGTNTTSNYGRRIHMTINKVMVGGRIGGCCGYRKLFSR